MRRDTQQRIPRRVMKKQWDKSYCDQSTTREENVGKSRRIASCKLARCLTRMRSDVTSGSRTGYHNDSTVEETSCKQGAMQRRLRGRLSVFFSLSN